MIVKIGSYSFQMNEAGLDIQRSGMVGDNGLVFAWQHTWRISGRLIRDTVAELTTAIRALDSACQLITGDVRVLFDDGSNTAHVIRFADTLNGIRVIQPPSFPTSAGAEYVNYRTFQLTVQAEVGFTNGPGVLIEQSALVNWSESVTISGGFPRDVVLLPINGPPVQQRVSPQTPYRGLQAGEAVGLRSYPNPPATLFPEAALEGEGNPVTRESPRVIRTGARDQTTEFPIRWAYRAISPDPLFGTPNRRP